jgi:ArsR family transcriptional regulator
LILLLTLTDLSIIFIAQKNNNATKQNIGIQMPRGRGRGRMLGPMNDPRSKLFLAFANDQRIRIIQELRKGERSSSELIELLQLDPSVVSRHLSLMRDVGIIHARKEGVALYFSLADKRVLQMLDLATKITKDWYMKFQDFFY